MIKERMVWSSYCKIMKTCITPENIEQMNDN